MGSTTLFTFLFEHPTRAQTVELLGSWDNFAKPYPLQRDRRRGRGIWSGCYTFDNIIFDGDFDHQRARRSGALKMGGTYWYYYNVDGEECHNPAEPSTTVCPLLPGQRTNILEVPRESGSQCNTGNSDGFTRNPQDKYLTPVPPTMPKALASPRLGDLCRETYRVPMHSATTPRSATYPSGSQPISPGYVRHARSASTTPAMQSTALFADFKCLKEKLAQKRTAAHSRSKSTNVRGLVIGPPKLISSTAEEVNLVPLSTLQHTPVPSPLPTPQSSSSLPSSVRAKMREFSPLGSHPIIPVKDLHQPETTLAVNHGQGIGRPRSRSEVATPTTAQFPRESASLARGNSMDTRRTKIFSNEPWLSSPKLPRRYDLTPGAPAEQPRTAPVLQRPTISLDSPSVDARPTSSHGGDQRARLRQSVLDKNKDLPALPSYLFPAPLFTPSNDTFSTDLTDEPEQQQNDDEPLNVRTMSVRHSHFSTWSTESVTFSSAASDEDVAHSPTFSSLTSNCSDAGSPSRLSRFSISDYIHSPDRTSSTADEEFDEQQAELAPQEAIPDSPPKLGELCLSSFGPSLFDLDIQHADSAPRRMAACYGLGFQSYKLPDDETCSKVTITGPMLHPQPTTQHTRGNSVTHLEKLVNEFGFLGESVA